MGKVGNDLGLNAHMRLLPAAPQLTQILPLLITQTMNPPKKQKDEAPSEEDKVSVYASQDEDVENLLKYKRTKTESRAQGAKKNNDETFLKELADQLDNCESSGPDVNVQLAAIVNKHWSRKLAHKKLKPILDQYKKAENCSALIPTRVNPEIWSQLQSGKKRADLKVANMQQCLHKVVTATTQIAKKPSPSKRGQR